MLTLCWAAKGGSGTTVYAASAALTSPTPVLLIDLAGDLPMVFGMPEPDGPGVHDWVRSDAPAARLELLEVDVRPQLGLLAAGTARADPSSDRWAELASFCVASDRVVIVDAGTGDPPPALFALCERRWLVTRACYLAITRANNAALRPNGVVLVEEPGRSLRRDDIETSLGAPVVTRISFDPAISRAVDSGLLVARLPYSMTRPIRRAA